ncbi:hypothetical protein PG984_014617 [Apiospora sp. TS-2023a]
MAETFGVLVGVGQVVGSVFSLIKSAQSFIDGPDTLRRYEKYFLELHNTIQPILNDPSLETEDVQQLAADIIDRIKASGIEDMVKETRRRQRMINFFGKGRHLPKLQDELEGKRQNISMKLVHFTARGSISPREPLSDHNISRPLTAATPDMSKPAFYNIPGVMTPRQIVVAMNELAENREIDVYGTDLWLNNWAHGCDQYNGFGNTGGNWVFNFQEGTGNQYTNCMGDPADPLRTMPRQSSGQPHRRGNMSTQNPGPIQVRRRHVTPNALPHIYDD